MPDLSVLLVDDQDQNLLVLEAILEPLGHRLVKARSGFEALRRLLEEEFAVILLDVQMPGMDGYETAHLIRERERTHATPIIFVTAGFRSDEHVLRGYTTGAVDYILKPVEPEILRAKVSVFVELAARKAEVERLAEMRAVLLAELKDKNRELEAARRQLEAANKELEAFSYSVSHDLRAPLRGIDGFSQVLLEDYQDKLDAAGQDSLRRVRTAAQRMGELIDGLLALSRVTRGELEVERVDLSERARAIVADLRQRDPGRTVEVVIAGGLTACGDARLLGSALENLIGNAWKYSSRTPRARVEFGAEYHGGERVYFVRDNGAGFDMAHADRLFGTFQRLHSPGEFAGTGVGLATVQRIIHRHGGRVWAEGRVGEGATFFFTLPAEEGLRRAAGG